MKWSRISMKRSKTLAGEFAGALKMIFPPSAIRHLIPPRIIRRFFIV
jgi:hypothetical protein